MDMPDSMGDLEEAAIAQHEMYMSWVAAGFTPEQALELVKVLLVAIYRGVSE